MMGRKSQYHRGKTIHWWGKGGTNHWGKIQLWKINVHR